MKEKNLQQETNKTSAGGEKGTNFTRMCNEYLEFFMNRKNIELSPIHYRLILFFVRSLQGWDKEQDVFSQKQIAEAIGTSICKANLALNEFIGAGILTKHRQPGTRNFSYGFNKLTFGRSVATDTPRFTTEVIRDKLYQDDKLNFTQVGKSEVTTLVNRKSLKILKFKRNSRSKDILKNIKDISLSKFREFLAVQPKQARSRWERFIGETIKTHPEDQELLLLAIELVHKEKKDFFGNRIHSSIIGLFEKCDWSIMREALLVKLKKDKAEREKEDRKRENERLVAETKQKLQSEMEHGGNETPPEIASQKLAEIRQKLTRVK